MSTYSFISVQATITGPNGSFSLGYGSGNAEEGISVEMLEDKDDLKVGSDGSLMHSLRASQAARVTVRLLKTAPTNKPLQDLYNGQRLIPALWGNNVIVVSDVDRGDVLTVSQAAFMRQTPITYAKDGNMNEWSFVGNLTQLLGSGTPAAA